jgi:AraC-like DNA-binding protein
MRFTSSLGFLLFVIDRRANQPGEDNETAFPPVWRQPQPCSHRHEEHEINLVVEGAARYHWWNSDGEKTTLTVPCGRMLAIPGGVEHIIEVTDHALVRGIWIHPECVAELLSTRKPGVSRNARQLCQFHHPLPPLFSGSATLYTQLLEICEQTQREIAQDDVWHEQALSQIAQMATLAFVRLMESRPALPNSSAQERIEQVHSWMQSHYLERPTLEQLSRRAGLSPSHFSEMFRQFCGSSPGAFLLQCRLRFAGELLATTHLPIAQIADMAGFEHAANFTQLFKEHRGQTPSQFRRSHRNKDKNSPDIS